MKNIVSAIAVLGATCAFGEMTAKTAWSQRWPWDTKVDIDFSLSGGEKCDISVTASFTTNGTPGTVDLERAGAEGDFWELEPGRYHLVWDPAAAGLDVAKLENFSVTVTPVENASDVRKWLVLSLTDGTWEYASETPAGGWTGDYKTSKMVFRRIPAGSFTAGLTSEEVSYLNAEKNENRSYYIPQKTMTITHDYYIAIYKTTKAQFERFTNTASTSTDAKPQVGESVYYPYLRGSNSVDGIDWPTTRFAVKEGSIIGNLRNRFSNRFWLDLPTSAQWEKAARAGTDTFWYNGGTVDTSYSDCTNLVNQIAYTCLGGAGQFTYVNVGSYLANSYGLCDTVGMRPEYVLDRFVDQAAAASETYDPVGPTSGTLRAVRSQLNQNNHGLRYYTLAHIATEAIDNTTGGTCLAFRFAIHLRPPRSFSGMWK